MRTTIETGSVPGSRGVVTVSGWQDHVGRIRAVSVAWTVTAEVPLSAAEARAVAFALNMYADAVVSR